MPTVEQVRAQLTGPDGQFEVITGDVDGVEMKVFKNRFPDLRVIAQFGLAHGEKEFIVYGDRRITFDEFVRTANSVSRALITDAAVTKGDRVAVLSQNNPEWCLAFWGTVDIGAVLVGLNGWWTNDEIIYGLTDSGAKVLVADRKRFERVADDIDDIDTLERVYLIDADPSDFPGPDGTPSPKLHRFDELTAAPTTEFPDRRARRRRPRGHLLHVRHHRPAQGGDQHPPVDDRQPPEHRVPADPLVDDHAGARRRRPRRAANRSRCSPRRCSTSRAPTPAWWSG